MVRNVKVLPGEECVSQHRLVIADMILTTTTQKRIKYTP